MDPGQHEIRRLRHPTVDASETLQEVLVCRSSKSGAPILPKCYIFGVPNR